MNSPGKDCIETAVADTDRLEFDGIFTILFRYFEYFPFIPVLQESDRAVFVDGRFEFRIDIQVFYRFFTGSAAVSKPVPASRMTHNKVLVFILSPELNVKMSGLGLYDNFSRQ